MTSQEIQIRTQRLEEMRATKGWTEILAPELSRRIERLEERILAAGPEALGPEDTFAARVERDILVKLRDTPQRLVDELASLGRRVRKN